MLDDNFKKSAIEKLKSMDSNELKKAFKEIGSEPETNEEWFCQLSTEEKAVIFSLLSYRCNICDGTPTNQCPFDRCVRGLKDFIKWLKQPHHNE